VNIPFTGKPRWLTKQGAKLERLIITYDPVKRRRYARVSVEVTLERKCTRNLKAGIDMGRERLIAFVTEPVNGGEGVALLYRGGPLKSDYFYFERKITEIDRMLADPKLEEMDRDVLREEVRRRLYDKQRRRREQIFANMAAHLIKKCAWSCASALCSSRACAESRDKPGRGNTNMWGYRGLRQRLTVTLENHGITLFEIPENGASKVCARHAAKFNGCREI
jgi:putative transposase